MLGIFHGMFCPTFMFLVNENLGLLLKVINNEGVTFSTKKNINFMGLLHRITAIFALQQKFLSHLNRRLTR